MRTSRSFVLATIFAGLAAGGWTCDDSRPNFIARLTVDGEPADLAVARLWAGTEVAASYGIAEDLPLGALAFQIPTLVASTWPPAGTPPAAGLPLGVWGTSTYGTPREGEGPWAWWLKVEGYKPVLFGPVPDGGMSQDWQDPSLEADLEPISEPQTCIERFGPSDPSVGLYCEFDLQFPAAAAPLYVVIQGGWPETIDFNWLDIPPLVISEPGPVGSVWAFATDGVTNYVTFIAAAPGYVPDIQCVPCGAEVVFNLVPHGLDARPAACSVGPPPAAPKRASSGAGTGGGLIAASAAFAVFVVVLRERRRGNRDRARP